MRVVPDAEFHRAACMAKRGMPSLEYALNRAWLITNANLAPVGVYQCRECGEYHVTRTLDASVLFCGIVWAATGPTPAP